MVYSKEDVKSFQKIWTLEKLKSMTLEIYSNYETECQDNFIYCVIYKYKTGLPIPPKDKMKEYFGIYRHMSRRYSWYPPYNGDYYWGESLGNTENRLLKKIKNEIIKVAQYSQKGKLDEIDNLKLLHFDFKWRIAFLYKKLRIEI